MSSDSFQIPNIQTLVTALPRATLGMGRGRFMARALTLAYCLVFSALALAAWAWLTGSLHPWARLSGKLFFVMASL